MKFLRGMIGKKERDQEVDEMIDEFTQSHKHHHELDPAEDEDIYACLESIQSRLQTQDTDTGPASREPEKPGAEKMDAPKEDTVDHLVDLVAEMAPAAPEAEPAPKTKPPVADEPPRTAKPKPRVASTVPDTGPGAGPGTGPEKIPAPDPVAKPAPTPVATTQAAPVTQPRPVADTEPRPTPKTFRPAPETEPEPATTRVEKPAPAPAQPVRAEKAPTEKPARPAAERPETPAKAHLVATPPADATASGVPSAPSSPGLVDIPAPAAGRSGRRAGRVKTRLLGFEHAGEIAADPFAKPAQPSAKQGMEFPVGWIVVTKGPGRGVSFSLCNGVSNIGRGDDQAIRLDFGDTSISRDNHAAIAYDDERRMFFLGHGGKANLVRLNENPVLSTEELTHGDTIRIGETTLRFIAFCGPDFDWNADAGDSSEHAAIA